MSRSPRRTRDRRSLITRYCCAHSICGSFSRVRDWGKLLQFWPWLAAICSGLLYAACFAPFNLTWCCWIALTPLIAAIWFSGTESRHPWLRNLLLGYVAVLTFFWAVFFWLTTVTVLGWFVLEFYMAIYFAMWAWFCGLLRPRAGKRQSPAP